MLSPRERAFVNTYNPPNAPDPADVVADYRRVREYASHHPKHGRVRAGNVLEIDSERIRSWLNGGRPDCVRGLDIAHGHGWLNIDETPFRQLPLAILLAGTFACGGIDRQWRPAWAPESDLLRARIAGALDELVGGHNLRHDSAADRPTELYPAEDASVFGRVLVAYGAAHGHKNETSVGELPGWLLEAPIHARRAAVEVFVLERGTFYDEKDTVTLRTHSRTQRYRDSLAALIRSVTEGGVTSSASVVLSAEAVRDLGFGRADAIR